MIRVQLLSKVIADNSTELLNMTSYMTTNRTMELYLMRLRSMPSFRR